MGSIVNKEQLKILLWKNWRIKRVNRSNTLCELIFPIFFMGMLVSFSFQDVKLQVQGTFFNLTPSFAFAPLMRTLIGTIVLEKKTKLRETLRIMGMSQGAYVCSWIITQLLLALIIALIVIMMAFADSTLFGPWHGQFALCILLSGLAYIAYGFMLTPFFSSPQLANQLGIMLHIIPAILFYVVQNKDPSTKYGLSVFPQVAALVYLNQAVYDTFPDSGVSDLGVNKNVMLGMMVATAIVFFLAFAYFDQVLPNEFGIKKHWLWLCRKKVVVEDAYGQRTSTYDPNRRSNKRVSQKYQKLSEDEQDVGGISMATKEIPEPLPEDYPQHRRKTTKYAKFQESIAVNVDKRVAVEIDRLTKKFGNFKAVDNLNLDLYINEIFCILGHNGAGKTTTLNVLTGIYPPSRGTARIFGNDINYDIDNIRTSLGLCQQFDVVVEELTVEEHLRLMCGLRCLDKSTWDERINEALDHVDLNTWDSRTKLPKQLSGGMKRRLSMALALLGYSNLIVLDEPTSGLDPMTRQEVWKIIRKIKENRCVILTTQHLDQADELADRIGIMSHGELLCLGTASYIKRRFGVGYHLVIEPKIGMEEHFDGMKDEAMQIIKEIIPDSEKDPKSARYQISFLLPFKYLDTFPKLFHELQKFQGLQLNVEISSLQDAFINIARIEEEAEQQENKDDIELQEKPKKRMDFYRTQELLKLRIPRSFSNPPRFFFWRQTFAVVKKRLLTFHRDLKMWILLFFSVIIMIISIAAFQSLYPRDTSTSGKVIHQYFFANLYSAWVVIALALCTGIFIETPVYERENKLRYAFKVTGLRVIPYWLGSLIADYILYLLPGLWFVALVFLFNEASLTSYVAQSVLLYIVFGGPLITFMYLFNYCFSKSQTAFRSIGFIMYLFGFVIPVIAEAILKVFGHCTINKVVDAFLSIIPVLQLYNAQFDLMADYIYDNYHTLDSDYFRCRGIFPKCWHIIIFFVIQTFIYLCLTIFIDMCKTRVYASSSRPAEPLEDPRDKEEQHYDDAQRARADTLKADQDVLKEAQKVQNGFATDALINENIQAKGLHKTYPNGFQAVKGTSFTVGKNEVLGLLGPNGAGKSTTFNMLTLDIPMTQGSVRMLGQDLRGNMQDVFLEMGMCPQYNPIWDKLTVLEHLEIFADIKGLTEDEKKDQMFYLIKSLKLEEYVHKNAENLSGGNKRKLCTAISQIACPLVSFFDEPTTGVDPVSRRNLWFSLKNSSGLKGGSLVLTTHRMDEAETLCDKIAIMINGRFVCFGSPQQLRNKYGQGYFITIKANPEIGIEGKQRVTVVPYRRIQEDFPSAELHQGSEEETEHSIKISTSDMVLSHAFEILLDMKDKETIKEFSVAQSTLQQVFIYFARYQRLNPALNP